MSSQSPFELPSLQRLQSAEQNELLNVIDSLRAQGMGDFISLPQLIVCGDQSSGKSSVLKAISGIPFPRQETLCTRFATEVVLRRMPKDKVTASIVPEKGRAISELLPLKDFQHELKTQDDFNSLFDKAGDAMGFSTSGKSFSKDILRVEICGPSQPQLTLVDLPGLIHTTIKAQTSGDVLLVHDLVEQYLKSPRSIILAVVSAKNDVSNQIILDRARKFDVKGRRTLGIITKPDTLTKDSKNEDAFIALARNEDVPFALGWHVVKNLDSADQASGAQSRDAEETRYFETSNFSRLPSHILGITFLRSRLSKVLFEQIRTELPKLVEEIESKVSSTKEVFDKLGPSRVETEEQRNFLISLSQSFHTICRDAVRGNYEHEFFQGVELERRLCAYIMNRHFDFARNMRSYGTTWKIIEGSTAVTLAGQRTREHSIKEACALLKRSRGRELPGLPNPSLVGELFKDNSKPWRRLARAHIKSIWEAANRFLDLLLGYLTDNDVCDKIQRHWLLPKMEEMLNTAYGKLDELLAVHEDQPMTTNTQFLSNSKLRRPNKSDSELVKKIKDGDLKGVDDVEIARLLSNRGKIGETDMDMMAAEEALDNMNAFYEVALNLFTDNVPTLAVQSPIVRRIPNILCPTAVFSMEAELLKNVAGESEEKVIERTALAKKLKILEDGARICKQYARSVRPLPSSLVDDRVELDTSSAPWVDSTGSFRFSADQTTTDHRGRPAFGSKLNKPIATKSNRTRSSSALGQSATGSFFDSIKTPETTPPSKTSPDENPFSAFAKPSTFAFKVRPASSSSNSESRSVTPTPRNAIPIS